MGEEIPVNRARQALAFLRKNAWQIAREGSINFALPYLIFIAVQPRFGDVYGLIASSAPPMLWSIVEFARNRKVDALSILVLLGIGLSLVAFYGGGGVKFLQLREKLVTVIIGAVFLGSAAIGRPLIYQLARATLTRRGDKTELTQFESFKDNAGFRRTMTLMTLVWGFGLVADATVSAALVFALPIRTYLIVNRLLGYATMGSLSLWTFLYGRKMRRRGDALRAAQANAERQAAEELKSESLPAPS